MSQKHLNISIFGTVQGVFFRISTKKIADRLEIVGFAQNKPDGSVFIEAEGDSASLDLFLDWCRQGPPNAKVAKLNFSEGKIKSFKDFQIL